MNTVFADLEKSTLDRAFISTLMHSQHRFLDMVAVGITADLFEDKLCSRIWRAMEHLTEHGGMFDYVLIREAMRAQDPECVVLLSEIAEIDHHGTSEAYLVHYAETLNVRSGKKTSAVIGGELIKPNESTATPVEFAEFVSERADKLMDVATQVLSKDELNPSTIFRRASKEVLDASEREIGVRVGIRTIDGLFGGMRPGEMFVVGARPGEGKSSFACTVASNLLRRTPEAIVFYASVEMREEEIAKRMISIRSNVPAKAIEERNATPSQLDAWYDAQNEYERTPIHVAYKGMQSVANIFARTTRLKKRMGRMDLLIVDGLHAMAGKGENRTAIVTKLSADIREIAATLSIPVLVCVQLNRESEKNNEKKPTLANLRDSGALEQDADAVIFLHTPDATKAAANAIIAKNRRGQCGTVQVAFHRPTTRFTDLEHEYKPPERF